jgi:putative Holliday junction resolvase
LLSDIENFKSQIKPYRAIIGFDYGSKRLGIAVSDLMHTVATPYTILQRQSFDKDLAFIKKVIEEKEIGAIVFGLPLQMNGEEGDIAREVREFADKIKEHIDLPVFFWDERLSSSAMERFLIEEVDLSRAKRKKVLDSSAAAYILQGVLDALQYIK